MFLFLVPALLPGQAPRIGAIEFYGLHHVKEERIRKALGVKVGDPLPPSKAEVEDQIEAVPDVALANLDAECCVKGDAILYVGIEEKGAPHYDLHEPPEGKVELPSTVMENYQRFLRAVQEATRIGEAGEDFTLGHSLMEDSDCRALQDLFVGYAGMYLSTLRDVLRNSADDEQRAAAAYIIGYSSDQTAVTKDLQYALSDPDDGVRSNAMRALTAIAVFSQKNPDLKIRVEPTWFIEMLNSILWGDRERAAKALVTLTDSRSPEILSSLRERALSSLVDMATWKTPEHALPAFILLGRIAGVPENQIHQAWLKQDRETIIEDALDSGKRK